MDCDKIILSLSCLIDFSIVSTDISFNGSKFRYELLDILEFTSDRKRMSVVVKDGQTGKIHLLSKGADEAILPRAYPGNGTTMKSALCHHSSNVEFSQDAWILYALSDKFAYYNILRCLLLNLFIMG